MRGIASCTSCIVLYILYEHSTCESRICGHESIYSFQLSVVIDGARRRSALVTHPQPQLRGGHREGVPDHGPCGGCPPTGSHSGSVQGGARVGGCGCVLLGQVRRMVLLNTPPPSLLVLATQVALAAVRVRVCVRACAGKQETHHAMLVDTDLCRHLAQICAQGRRKEPPRRVRQILSCAAASAENHSDCHLQN